MSYDYVLSNVDESQQGIVRDRLTQYLNEYGSNFNAVIGYATSKVYREVISEAVSRSNSDGVLHPQSPNTRQLTEHFRQANLDVLRDEVESVFASTTASGTEQFPERASK